MKRIFLFFLVMFLALDALAEWAPMSRKELLKETDLVVVATLSNVKGTTKKHRHDGSGTLTVTQVLKGPATANQKLTLQWAYSTQIVCPRIDHSISSGQTNIWLLQKTTGNTYTANYPGRVIELGKLAEVKKALEK